MYTYIYIYIYICTYVYMYICSGLRIDIRKFSFVNTASTNVSILCGARFYYHLQPAAGPRRTKIISLRKDNPLQRVCVCVCLCVYTYIYIYIHMFVRTHTYTYTYVIHTCTLIIIMIVVVKHCCYALSLLLVLS